MSYKIQSRKCNNKINAMGMISIPKLIFKLKGKEAFLLIAANDYHA